MAALASGHAATDFANGALPALLPFFVDRFDLSYTLAGLLILASAFSSSVIQPFFGLWSDRRGAIWLLPTGVAVAGLGIALAANAPRYWLVLLFVLVSGVGCRRVPPGRLEVRGVHERPAAGERDVALLDRREPRLRARPGDRDAARPLAGPARRAPARRPVPRRSRPCSSPPAATSRASLPSGPGIEAWPAKTGPVRAGPPARRDRPAERLVVRADHVRAAVGGLAGTFQGVWQPAADLHAAGGPRRDACGGAARRSHRPPPGAHREHRRDCAAHARLRRRRRRGRGGSRSRSSAPAWSARSA